MKTLILIAIMIFGTSPAWAQIDNGTSFEVVEPRTAKSVSLEQKIADLEDQVTDLQNQLKNIANMVEKNQSIIYQLNSTITYLFDQLQMTVPSGPTEIINDDFDDGYDGWQFQTIISDHPTTNNEHSNYVLTNPDGIVHIAGGGFLTDAGIIKRLILPDSDSITLDFDGQATGTYPSHRGIPNLEIIIFNDYHEPEPLRTLGYKDVTRHYVVTSNQAVSDWQDVSFDLTDYAGQDVSIYIGLYDPWIANWQQTVSIDNIVIMAE